jgi:hypothetical protein
MTQQIKYILQFAQQVRAIHRNMAEDHPNDDQLLMLYEVSEAYYVSLCNIINKTQEIPYYEGLQNSPLPKQSLIL